MKPEDIRENSRAARRMSDIQPFHVMALLARARELEAQGRSIIHMEIGEPDFPTPQPVIDAGIRALQQGDIHSGMFSPCDFTAYLLDPNLFLASFTANDNPKCAVVKSVAFHLTICAAFSATFIPNFALSTM